jgi:hypothetical protein
MSPRIYYIYINNVLYILILTSMQRCIYDCNLLERLYKIIIHNIDILMTIRDNLVELQKLFFFQFHI